MATLGVYYNVTDMGFFCARTLSLKFLKLKKTKILKHLNNFAVMAILGDFGEFEGPVPEPPYSYHHPFLPGPDKSQGCSPCKCCSCCRHMFLEDSSLTTIKWKSVCQNERYLYITTFVAIHFCNLKVL